MNENPMEFSCRMENVKLFSELLSCLALDANREVECNVEATPEALSFQVASRGNTFEGKLTLPSNLFEEYICSADSVKTIIKLTVFIDCLKLFGFLTETTIATLSYNSNDAIFKLSLEESGVLTVCDLVTLYSEEIEDQDNLLTIFKNTPEECQIIIKSDILKESLHEFGESTWLDSVKIEVNNNPQFMKLSAEGTVGATEIYIPRTSDAYISFHCKENIVSNFPIKPFLLGIKALSIAVESFLRINSDGILCIQHQIKSTNADCYVDYFILPMQQL